LNIEDSSIKGLGSRKESFVSLSDREEEYQTEEERMRHVIRTGMIIVSYIL